MRLLHDAAKIHATFDDPDLVSLAGLVPVMALARRAGLGDLVAEHVRIGHACGVNARVKVPGIVAGMMGGADSIDDLDVLRHGAMPDLFGGARAPSTLGSFLRSFTWGNVLQLEQVSRLVLAELADLAPLLPGKDAVAFVDIDSTQKRVYGHKKQGAAFGHAKVQGKSLLLRGLSALLATVSTPLGAPVIAARPDRHRRPDRPARPRPPHHAPALAMAPRARLAEPLRRRLRPASTPGLTSPDKVTTRHASHLTADPPTATRTSRPTVSGQKHTPAATPQDHAERQTRQIPQKNSHGGSRLRSCWTHLLAHHYNGT